MYNRHMRLIACAAFLALAAAFGQQKAPAWTEAEQPIYDRIRVLRKVPDDKRADETKALALAIRALTSRGQLSLATYLTGLSTEGDYGGSTLAEVASTLIVAIGRSTAPVPASVYQSLAQLIRYEHVLTTFDDPQLKVAFAQLDELDKRRQDANFKLKDISGKSWTLKDLRGQVVLVNFWATWCPPCRKEMPDLDALYKRFHKKGLVILSISDEPDATVQKYLADKDYKYPILLDPGRKVHEEFAIEGIPKSFVYDREGKLAAQAIDMRTMDQFLRMLHEAGLNQ
jgi:peroxiredoxin